MPGPEAWESFGQVALVIVFLSGVVLALRRLGVLSAPSKPPGAQMTSPDLTDLAARLERQRNDLHDHKLFCERNFIKREDWVPAMSKILAGQEHQMQMLARLDERMKHLEERIK